MGVRRFNPPGVAEVFGASLVAVGTGSRVVGVAGQVGRDLEGNFADGLGPQFARALANLSLALSSAGASMQDLLKMTVYIVGWNQDMAGDLLEGALAYAEGSGEELDPPATWTLVGVHSLYDPACLVEVEALAVLS